MTDPTPATPSDRDGAVLAAGRGDVTHAVVSMSGRAADGDDAAYLAWHVLDHLPEQHRLPGLRLGQRWVSTPACRALRAASSDRYDAVDHVVTYLFADPFGPALDAFFELGGALGRAGRMPLTLPRVDLAAYESGEQRAAERILVGADVVPWRPASGAYLVVDPAHVAPIAVDALVALPGVAGVWRWTGTGAHRPDRLAQRDGVTLTVAYLDGDPVTSSPAVGDELRRHWASAAAESLLAGPFHAVVPGDWARHVP